MRLTHSATNCLTLILHIIGGQVQLCQLGIGEAVHLPTGHVDPVRGIMESHTTHIRNKAHIKLNPLCPIRSSQPKEHQDMQHGGQLSTQAWRGRVILRIYIHLLPQHLLQQVLVRGWQLHHGHQTDQELSPSAHQMEGQGGQGCVDEDPGQVDDQPALVTQGEVEQNNSGGGHGAICLKYDARGNIYRY